MYIHLNVTFFVLCFFMIVILSPLISPSYSRLGKFFCLLEALCWIAVIIDINVTTRKANDQLKPIIAEFKDRSRVITNKSLNLLSYGAELSYYGELGYLLRMRDQATYDMRVTPAMVRWIPAEDGEIELTGFYFHWIRCSILCLLSGGFGLIGHKCKVVGLPRPFLVGQ